MTEPGKSKEGGATRPESGAGLPQPAGESTEELRGIAEFKLAVGALRQRLDQLHSPAPGETGVTVPAAVPPPPRELVVDTGPLTDLPGLHPGSAGPFPAVASDQADLPPDDQPANAPTALAPYRPDGAHADPGSPAPVLEPEPESQPPPASSVGLEAEETGLAPILEPAAPVLEPAPPAPTPVVLPVVEPMLVVGEGSMGPLLGSRGHRPQARPVRTEASPGPGISSVPRWTHLLEPKGAAPRPVRPPTAVRREVGPGAGQTWGTRLLDLAPTPEGYHLEALLPPPRKPQPRPQSPHPGLEPSLGILTRGPDVGSFAPQLRPRREFRILNPFDGTPQASTSLGDYVIPDLDRLMADAGPNLVRTLKWNHPSVEERGATDSVSPSPVPAAVDQTAVEEPVPRISVPDPPARAVASPWVTTPGPEEPPATPPVPAARQEPVPMASRDAGMPDLPAPEQVSAQEVVEPEPEAPIGEVAPGPAGEEVAPGAAGGISLEVLRRHFPNFPAGGFCPGGVLFPPADISLTPPVSTAAPAVDEEVEPDAEPLSTAASGPVEEPVQPLFGPDAPSGPVEEPVQPLFGPDAPSGPVEESVQPLFGPDAPPPSVDPPTGRVEPVSVASVSAPAVGRSSPPHREPEGNDLVEVIPPPRLVARALTVGPGVPVEGLGVGVVNILGDAMGSVVLAGRSLHRRLCGWCCSGL
ncbi:MAG: hypothetical protein HQL82_12010 [Magnetococcales bacterium]|nr:hypothetical protein [Magnetococcales bacterium]